MYDDDFSLCCPLRDVLYILFYNALHLFDTESPAAPPAIEPGNANHCGIEMGGFKPGTVTSAAFFLPTSYYNYSISTILLVMLFSARQEIV